MPKHISSIQNQLVKDIIQLQHKAKTRAKMGLFCVEGVREITLAQQGGFCLKTLLFCIEIIDFEMLQTIFDISQIDTLISVSKEVYQKIAYRESSEGVIAIIETKTFEIEALKLSKNPLILIAESPEKPGNIGALLRTADAAQIDAIIITNPKTDLFNPNVIRASLGCIFTTQIATSSTKKCIEFLKYKNINIYGATLQDSAIYYHENYTQPTALVVGTEATGLTETLRNATTKNINIPMEGAIDSMNVSVAAAILIFEAKRQRSLRF